MRSIFSLGVGGLLCLAGAAQAQTAPNPLSPAPRSTLEKVRAQGYLQCGSAVRPGLAAVDAADHWSGLEVEICRAVATAVFGADARYAYHKYESDLDYDVARDGCDQLSFLSFAEMAAQKLTDKVLPGPTIFVESQDLLVAETSPAKHPADLAGQGICFIIATAAENSVEAWFHAHKVEFIPFAFQEDGELLDTFNVQRCRGLAGETTTLATSRLESGVNHLKSRFLPDHLESFPIVAATPLHDDAQWAAIVAWTVDTVLNADAHETDDRANGLRAMAVEGAGLGLAPGWQNAVVDRVGSYSAIFRRTMGADSPLKLEPGLNRTVADGGVLLPPFRN